MGTCHPVTKEQLNPSLVINMFVDILQFEKQISTCSWQVFLMSLFYPRSTGRDKISSVGSMKQMRCYFNPEFHSNQGIIQDDDDIMSWWCLSWHDINDKLITTYHLIEHHGHTLTPLCSHLRFIFRVTLQYDFPLSQNKYLDNIVTKPSWIGLKM